MGPLTTFSPVTTFYCSTPDPGSQEHSGPGRENPRHGVALDKRLMTDIVLPLTNPYRHIPYYGFFRSKASQKLFLV